MQRIPSRTAFPVYDDVSSLGNAKPLVRSKSDTTNASSNIQDGIGSMNAYNNQNTELNWSWNDTNDLDNADIYSWKLRKGPDGKIFCVYVIHVHMKSGLKWTVDKVTHFLFVLTII